MFDHPVHFCFYNCAIVAEKLTQSTSLISHSGVHYWSICLPQTQHLSIILISNPNIVTENAFSLWLFFYSNTIFVEVFKCNKYKATLYLGYF